MKRIIYALILSLVVVSGLGFANCEIKNETFKKPVPKYVSVAERSAALKKWEARPDGILYKKWKRLWQVKKVLAGAAKIWKFTRDNTNTVSFQSQDIRSNSKTNIC